MVRGKQYADHSEEENEFEVDEPEEIQNNASDDDWTPDKDTSGGRRTSTRLRNIPKSRAPIIDASSSDEEGSDDSGSKRKGSKNRNRARPPAKKHKVTPISTPITPSNNVAVSSDSEPTSTTYNNSNNGSMNSTVIKPNKDFTSGAFVLLKTDAANMEVDPPLWKIDGKALLQKYIPFEQDGKTLYKNTSVYSGWTINNKDNYYPVSVIFKQQTRKEHIIEFHRDQIKFGGESSEVTSSSAPEITIKQDKIVSPSNENSFDSFEKPVIKVKSFAVVRDDLKSPVKPIQVKSFAVVRDEPKIPVTPIQVETPTTPTDSPATPTVMKIDKNFSSGAFLVLRSEASNVDPPIWKIDGKSLLQKYTPFNQNGKVYYKNSAEYSGWSLNNKASYFPATVNFKQQNKKEHIVELNRIKWDEPNDSDS